MWTNGRRNSQTTFWMGDPRLLFGIGDPRRLYGMGDPRVTKKSHVLYCMTYWNRMVRFLWIPRLDWENVRKLLLYIVSMSSKYCGAPRLLYGMSDPRQVMTSLSPKETAWVTPDGFMWWVTLDGSWCHWPQRYPRLLPLLLNSCLTHS